MIEPLEAALEIHTFLNDHKIPYVIIGDIAVQYWGEPRFTRDVDITVMVPEQETDKFIKLITDNFKPRVSDPVQFAKKNRMLLLKASNNCEIDISLGIEGYEDTALKRAVSFSPDKNKEILVCSAEDLIIHKAIAGRPRDLEDIEGIIYRQSEKLDKEYIINWLRQFSAALEKPVDKEFEKLWKKLGE